MPHFVFSQELQEFKLKNGLKVCLHPTQYEEDNVVFQLFAMGGYSALTPQDRPSAMLAAEIAWESGLDYQTADQLSCELYQHSIELETKIQAFDRQIEGACPTQHLGTCLKLIQLIFNHQSSFEKEAFKRVLYRIQNKIRNNTYTTEFESREVFLKLHTNNWSVFDPLTLTDLDYVNLTKAEKFFRQCFSNPSEFTLVIVGDFDPAEVKSLIEKHLGALSNKPFKGPQNPPIPPFPTHIMEKEITKGSACKMPRIRVTFPILEKIDHTNRSSLNRTCQMIRNRLASIFQDHKLDVYYEFPFFPYLDVSWLIIQCTAQSPSNSHSTKNSLLPSVNQILVSLKELREQGPSEEELKILDRKQEEPEDFEIEENTYLLSLLTNYYRANWDVTSLYQEKVPYKVEKEVIKNDVNRYFKTDLYSIISFYP